ncbi:MAG TPA: DNA polymerase, partial [Candidatus Bathyarchaeia archaeon]|nr:DNA polymerase [Candidatus Bathyarchaeia archaeon]
RFIDEYFKRYGQVRRYVLETKAFCVEQGYVETLLGRRRYIPDMTSRVNAVRNAAERMAINMPIQGTAADVQKIAMIRLDDRLRSGGFGARMLLSVHDEILLEVPRDELDRLVPVVRETMESALRLNVPLTVDVKVGDDWESMTPLTRADAIAAEADEAPVEPIAG